jgi:hypothetical protein
MSQNTMPPRPQFTHAIMSKLYEKYLSIDKETINTILALPRQTLLADIKLLLTDAYDNIDKYDLENNGDEEQTGFVVHALLLLIELKAEEVLEWWIKFIENADAEDDFTDEYMGDVHTQFVSIYFAVAGKSKVAVLASLLKDVNLSLSTFIGLCEGLQQMIHHYEESGIEAKAALSDALKFYIHDCDGDEYAERIEYLIWCMAEGGMEEQQPLIEEYFSDEELDAGVIGPREYSQILAKKNYEQYKKPILSIFEIYEDIKSWRK